MRPLGPTSLARTANRIGTPPHAACEYPSAALDHSAEERARGPKSYQRVRSRPLPALPSERYFPNLTHLFPQLTSRDPAATLRAMRVLLNWLNEPERADKNPIIQTLANRDILRGEGHCGRGSQPIER